MPRCAVRDLRPLGMGDLGTLGRSAARTAAARDDRSLPSALRPVAGPTASWPSGEGVLARREDEPSSTPQAAAEELATRPQEWLEQLVREAVARHWQAHWADWWAEAKEELKSELSRHMAEVAQAHWSQWSRGASVAPATHTAPSGFGPLAQARAELERVRAWVDALGDLLEQGRLLQERVAQVAGTLQELRGQGGPLLRQLLGAWRDRTEPAPGQGGGAARPAKRELQRAPAAPGAEPDTPASEPATEKAGESARGSQLAGLLPLLVDLLRSSGSGDAVAEAGGA